MRRLWVRVYLWLTERLYHELAWAYELVAWVVSGGQWDRWRRQALDHVAGPWVLELGFGTGALLVVGRQRGLQMFGVEPSQEMQRMAERRLQRARCQVPRVYAVSQALPFADGAFDSVVATFPTSYVADPRTLREVWRVLRARRPGQADASFVVTGLGVTGRLWQARFITLLLGGFSRQALAEFEGKGMELGYHVSVHVSSDEQVQAPILVWRKV